MEPIKYGEDKVKILARACDFTRLPTWYREDPHYRENVEARYDGGEEKENRQWFKVLVALMNPADHWVELPKLRILATLMVLGHKVVIVDGYPDAVLLHLCRALTLDKLGKSGTIITSAVAQGVNKLKFQSPGDVRYVYTDEYREYANTVATEMLAKDGCHRVVNIAEVEEDELWSFLLIPTLRDMAQNSEKMQQEYQRKMSELYGKKATASSEPSGSIIQ